MIDFPVWACPALCASGWAGVVASEIMDGSAGAGNAGEGGGGQEQETTDCYEPVDFFHDQCLGGPKQGDVDTFPGFTNESRPKGVDIPTLNDSPFADRCAPLIWPSISFQ